MLRRFSSKPKVLICSSYMKDKKDFFDTFAVNTPYRPHLSYQSRAYSAALRFLKTNIPDIEIIEYPSWSDYIKKINEGWDVVGFSFLHFEMNEIIKMAEEAKKRGVREIWAGSYGALSPQASFADKRWIGYCEGELSRKVFNEELEYIRHPLLVNHIRMDMPPSLKVARIGGLYTQRGCPYRCIFCQTPGYAPKPSRIPLESIARVLSHYKKIGIKIVAIHDETFGIFPEHSRKVVEMLSSLGMRWSAGSRIDKILENLDYWSANGLMMVGFGIESLRNVTQSKILKQINTDSLPELRKRTKQKKIATTAYYMIGYEDDTIESICEDLIMLRGKGFDSHQLTVNTPFPSTLQWDYIKSVFGLIDYDPAHYDTRHLVWNHPNISAAQMGYMLRAGCAYLNRPLSSYIPGIARLLRKVNKTSKE